MSIRADAVAGFRDDDVTFFALVYHDFGAAEQCLGDLRRHYPTSRVILRSDGDPDKRFHNLAKRFRVDFRAESRLFEIKNGGAIIERMLEMFLERPTPYLFKIDPDTAIHRRFSFLPTRCGVFGTLQCAKVSPSIQGGCMGHTRDAVEQILRSQLLRDDRLVAPEKSINESPYFHKMAERASECGLASFDWIVGWVASALRIPMYQFDEVRCHWEKAPPNPNQRYAVTHPRGKSMG